MFENTTWREKARGKTIKKEKTWSQISCDTVTLSEPEDGLDSQQEEEGGGGGW